MGELELSVKLKLAAEQFVSALSGATSQFKQAMGGMENAAANAGNSVDNAFKNLGIRSGATIKAEIDKIKASFATLRDSDLGFADKERASLALNTRLRELGSELGSVSGQAKASGSAMQQAGQSSQSMSSSLAHAGHIMAELYVAWAALNGAFRLSKSILDAGIGLDKIMAQLQFSTGSAEGAAESMAFVRAEAERLGIDVGAAGEGFAKFAASVRGTSLEGQKAQEVFSGVADAAKVMQLSADETKGIFLALSQMMAKGKVQAEEFRGQLGDRLPIATSVAAEALGVTTAEFSRMLDAGELLSEDFLPKFAAALKENIAGALPAAVNTLDAQLARLGNSWTLAMQEIAKSGAMSEVAKIAEDLAAKIRAMSESGELQKFGKEFAGAMKTAGEAIVGVTSFVVDHADAIKSLLIVYAELRALSFINSFANMATGLIGASSAAQTAGASVGGLGKQLALLPARLTIALGVIITGVELYQQVTGFIDGIIAGQRKIEEAGRLAVSPVDGKFLVNARAARDAMEEINKKYFAGSDQSAMATGKIISDFRKLTVEAKGTGQALKEMLGKVDFTDQAAVDKALGHLDTLKRAGLLTGQDIRAGIGGELAKLSAKDFAEFQSSAIRTFDGSAAGARKLGIALDASVAEAFRRMGGDIEKFRTGIDTATSDAIANLKNIAANAQASSKEVGEAFNLALKTADNRKEVDLLGKELKFLAETGRLTGKDLEDAQTRYQAKLRETAGQIDGALGDAFKRLGIKSAEAMKAAFGQLVDDFDKIKSSGLASAEGIAAAYEKIKSSIAASVQAMTQASREALTVAKEHTTAVQATTAAITAQAAANTASANAQKADAEYARASAEAMKSGSESAMAKADALGVAAQAAHSAADAAQADAEASKAAAVAAQAEEAAKLSLAAAAANPSDATKMAAAAAQDYANKMAQSAEAAKQTAAEAHAVASEMASAASEASAMATGVVDAGKAMSEMSHYLSNAAIDQSHFAAVAENANAAWKDASNSVQAYIQQAQQAGQQTGAISEQVADIMRGAAGTGHLATEAMQTLQKSLQQTADGIKRNEDATRAWQSAMDSLRGAAASLKDELDRALGNDKAIEDRAYQTKKQQLADQLKAAQDAAAASKDVKSAADAQAAYQSALADLNQLHNINLKNIADAAAAKSSSDAKNHADELANIASEQAARDAAARDIANQAIQSARYGSGNANALSSGAAAAVASAAATNNSYGGSTIDNSITVNVTGKGVSTADVRDVVIPEIKKIMDRSR